MSKKLKVSEATSFCDGIEFYSVRNKRCMARAQLNEKGEISVIYERKEKVKFEKKGLLEGIVVSIITIAIAVIIAVVFAIISVAIARLLNLDELGFTLLEYALFTIVDFFITQIKTHKTAKQRRALRFHAAEHMAINAMRKLQRVPSLDEIKSFSRFSRNCGSTVEPLYFFVYIWGALSCFFITDFIYLLLGYFVILLLYMTGGFNFIQYLTTLPATDTELEVAIAGLQEWYNHETS